MQNFNTTILNMVNTNSQAIGRMDIVLTNLNNYLSASTVSTTDGVNFNVTNDAGISANYTNSAIANQVKNTTLYKATIY